MPIFWIALLAVDAVATVIVTVKSIDSYCDDSTEAPVAEEGQDRDSKR